MVDIITEIGKDAGFAVTLTIPVGTPRVIRAFVPRTAGFFEFVLVSASVSARQKGGSGPSVSASKNSVPDSESETGSMTGWWVFSLCPTTSTIQSPQTRRFGVDAK